MIIFHEGLPGSGKSYEAMLKHAIPALQAGRKCFARINGVDDPVCRTRVAEVSGLSSETIDKLWVHLSKEDLNRLPLVVEDNAFVFLDEAQNFWPTGRQKLSSEMMEFITEHRHRGIDLLLMGQLLKDVHATWRGRVDQRVVFNTLDGVGASARYSVNVMKATAPEKFQTVVKTIGKYDPAFFGMYRSHVSGAINTVKYKDPRATVWAGWGMRFGIPLMGVVAVVAVIKAWGYFHPEVVVKGAPVIAGAVEAVVGRPVAGPAAVPPAPREVAQAARSSGNFAGWVGTLNKQFRPRLMWWAQVGKTERGAIGWYDESERVQESFTFAELRAQGVEVVIASGAAVVAGTFATSWRPRELPRPGYGADAANGAAQTTSGRAGIP